MNFKISFKLLFMNLFVGGLLGFTISTLIQNIWFEIALIVLMSCFWGIFTSLTFWTYGQEKYALGYKQALEDYPNK